MTTTHDKSLGRVEGWWERYDLIELLSLYKIAPLYSVSTYGALTLETETFSEGDEGYFRDSWIVNPELTVNPEALLTVKVKNLKAVSHFKHPTCMQLHYASNFGLQPWNQQKVKNDAVVRFLLHALNIVLSCTLDANSPSRFSKDDATKPAFHEFSWPRSDEKLGKHTW